LVTRRWLQWLGDALSRVSEALVALLALLFAAEVVMRYGFNRPTGFADQVGALMMPAITFLALARTLREGHHVRVDLFIQNLPPRLAVPLARATDAIVLAIAALMTWYTARLTYGSYVDHERLMVGVWDVPLYLPQAVLPLGLALLTLQILLSMASVKPPERAPAAAAAPEARWTR
jgi:TRAP-type transport system small permease protein